MAAVDEGLDTIAGGSGGGSTLRLVWPQWQGAGTSSVRSLAAEFPFDGRWGRRYWRRCGLLTTDYRSGASRD
jgi:hypothetical protein